MKETNGGKVQYCSIYSQTSHKQHPKMPGKVGRQGKVAAYERCQIVAWLKKQNLQYYRQVVALGGHLGKVVK